jgi:decaprenylphospho-beta-D-erythro-pentofuranosid-2-ulose 2-reductase
MRILIFGATSAIAQEAARLFAADGEQLFLVARDPDKLEIVAADLRARGARAVDTFVMEATDLDRMQQLVNITTSAPGGLDMLLIAHGTLSDQAACQADVMTTLDELNINFASVVALLTHYANYFEARRRGTIAVISSVAGDRGRMSNYVYGAAKAGVSAFLQGLRCRLYKAGVKVVTIKPGFVDSPMTAHLKKNPLYASAQQVGRGLYSAMKRGSAVVYLPWFWSLIMLIIRNLPDAIMKRTKL